MLPERTASMDEWKEGRSVAYAARSIKSPGAVWAELSGLDRDWSWANTVWLLSLEVSFLLLLKV